MLALERNELLSRLGGTKPDSVEWNAAFVRQVVLYVGLPLLAAIVGIFPELGDWLVARLSSVARIIPSGN